MIHIPNTVDDDYYAGMEDILSDLATTSGYSSVDDYIEAQGDHDEEDLKKKVIILVTSIYLASNKILTTEFKKQFSGDITTFVDALDEEWVKSNFEMLLTIPEVHKYNAAIQLEKVKKYFEEKVKETGITMTEFKKLIPNEQFRSLLENYNHLDEVELKKLIKFLNIEATTKTKNRVKYWAVDQIGNLYTNTMRAKFESNNLELYIWRTQEDIHVRPAHVIKNGTTRNINEYPRPGEEDRCRCYMELA